MSSLSTQEEALNPGSKAIALEQTKKGHLRGQSMSSKSSQTSSQSKSILSVQNIVLASVAWGLIALFIFLFGSPIVPRPLWYTTSTYLLENIAFLCAGLLCFRNWRSSQIVSGRTVWLLIGAGMFFYFVANLLLWWWERSLGYAPDVSPADLFYLSSYLLLGIGMLMAVTSKQLNLSVLQWLLIAGIAIAGIFIAYFVSGYAGSSAEEATYPTVDPAQGAITVMWTQPTLQPGATTGLETWAQRSPSDWLAQVPETPANSSTEPIVTEESVEAPVEDDPLADKPSWVVTLDNQLAPLADVVWILYLAGDTFLMVMAVTLLLAFWGGRFSVSWRFIAAAGFSLYLADIWYYYAIANIENYETGSLPEVFWIFSAVLFCIGAAVEYNLSTRSRRSRRRT